MLYAWRFDAAYETLASLKAASLSPGARAGAGSVGGRFGSEDLPLPPGGSETSFVDLDLIAALALPEGAAPTSALDRKVRPADFAPSRLQRSGVWFVRRRSWPRSSTARHLAIASSRFQNPFLRAGLSAFASEGPIPVSMSG